VNPEVFNFKVKSTFTNSMTHLSPTISMTIFCNNNYAISSQAAAPANPSYIAHFPVLDGFVLPTYIHPQITGCPITNWEVTSSPNSVVSMSTELNNPIIENGLRVVKPFNN